MSIVSDIIATIIKTSVGNLTKNELIKELMNILTDDISEKGIDEIVTFIIRQKTKITHILSSKNMKLLNINNEKIEFISFELKEFLLNIDISDKTLIQCKYNEKRLEEFLWKSYYSYKKETIECESEIKKILGLVSKEILNLKRECIKFYQNILIDIDNTVCDINEEIKQMQKFMENEIGKLGYHNQIMEEIINENISKNNTIIMKKCRTHEYIKKWNENMFLNNFDKRDENAGINVSLKDVYLEEHLPHYIWKDNSGKKWDDLKDLLSEYINEKNDNKMLLILGQPGIGKSTLITWITANFVDMIDKILVYQFASDLKPMNYQNINDVSDELCNVLDLSYDDLEGKTLILDGFDEINIENRIEILNSFYRKLIKYSSFKQFSLIITCRENYIQDLYRAKFNYITLQPLTEKQIQSFCHIYQEKTKKILSENTMINIIKNKNILGISLILYMVLALDITLENNSSIVDIYDKIFSLKEGVIYDRCIGNAGYADLHRISSIKRQIHLISEKIAFWMFENNSEEEYIPQEEYQKICTNVMQENENENINQDFLIGNFFKLVKHCEGIESERLYFVHRSIYEYFVTEYIVNSVHKVIYKPKEELAGILGDLFKRNILSYEILEFLKYKIKNSKLNAAFDIITKAFQLMLQDGMTYYTHKCYKNVIDCEMIIFSNMLEIIDLWKKDINISLPKNFDCYLRYNYANMLNLVSMNLESLYLNKVNLQGAYLIEANLKDADLIEANLKNAYLIEANLKDANLKDANLKNADLTDANLTDADLTDADLTNADLTNADLKGAFLTDAYLKNADLKKADLQYANLQRADLKGANLTNANLTNANLKYANLTNADLTDANLTDADLKYADLKYADLTDADLQGTDLKDADLKYADLTGVNLKNVNLTYVDLKEVLLDENQVNYLKNKYDLHETRVYIEETKNIISYEKYYKLKQ